MKNNCFSLKRCNLLLVAIWAITTYSFGQNAPRRAFQPPGVFYTTPYGANATAGRYAQTSDAKIYYEVYGKGEPVVLLHGGLLGSIMEYADLIEKLKPTYQVIAVSTRGHGKSEIGREPLTLTQRAEDVLAVMKQVTTDSVTLIGFSDGGYTAYTLAARYPERVKKLIVIGAGELKPGYRKFKLTARDAIRMDSAFWQQQLALMPEPHRLQDVFTQVNRCYSQVTMSKEILSKIKCPTLVVGGDRDDGNPVERVVRAARYIPRHAISIIPDAGHGCHNDNFNAFWATVSPFLKHQTSSFVPFTAARLSPYQVQHELTTLHQQPVLRVVKIPQVLDVDEPTFVKIMDENFKDGQIEVKVLSRLLPNAPDFARGFIGVAFRINETNTAFESIYLRPTNGQATQQLRRNHTLQYFSYPNYKFDRLRKESPEVYESYAALALNTWHTMRIVVKGSKATLFLDDNTEPALIVEDLKHGSNATGHIGLWVDIGTEGFFKDLKITHTD